MGRSCLLSVIIPTLNEAACIERAVRSSQAIGDEVIVADGGSTDGTAQLAANAGALVVQASRGRGRQLRAGAQAAEGEVLLFLHADAALTAEARHAILSALAEPAVVGGNFKLRYYPNSLAARVFGWLNHQRRRWLCIYYGDSAIFVRRAAYERLSGFRNWSLFEDYDFARRLECLGTTCYIESPEVVASARRFQRKPLRTAVLWTTTQVLFSLGISPERIASMYAHAR